MKPILGDKLSDILSRNLNLKWKRNFVFANFPILSNISYSAGIALHIEWNELSKTRILTLSIKRA